MNRTPLASPASPPAGNPPPQDLGKALRQRHVTMISLGGIIGAGLFVGSSATISAMGPGAFLSYLLAGIVVLFVMRMLGEMALAHPGIGSFTEYTRLGLGNWAGFTNGWLYWYFWVIVVAVEAVAGGASLGVALIAYQILARRRASVQDCATGYRASHGSPALGGAKP